MLGGVIGGYWAIGNVKTAILPANVMTMDITAAKIGRSMKKRENTFGSLARTVRAGSMSEEGFSSLTLPARTTAS
jgi:hypothetical protein